MSKENSIISLEHISKSFSGKKVLDDISLYINRGEFLTFLGPSGCGKTTLLRLIAGFLSPDEGIIRLEGKDISPLPPHKRPLNTVFQRYALFPHLDVYDNIAFGLKLHKVPKDEIERRVRKVLRLVSMSDYEDRDVASLSGGQQQRIAIARAIVNQPKVLLLDEPLSALDLKMRKDMQIELKEMHEKLGITFIYVTHDQEEALALSDTIVVMDEGRIQQIGTPADIYNEPQNCFVADFIGDSNIFIGRMLHDKKVSFIGHDFDCVDKGFGEDKPVYVVIRPEDVYIRTNPEGYQFTGTVTSCVFKGVHYEMFINTDNGFELMVQDYNAFEVGSLVALKIRPQDIQVMKMDMEYNSFKGVMSSDESVELLDAEFPCLPSEDFHKGEEVSVKVAFNKVDLMDEEDEGETYGNIDQIYYFGDHYHLRVKLSNGQFIFADTNDVWDKGDIVGVHILPEDIVLSKND